MHLYNLQSYKAQSLPQKDLFYLKEKADPDRASLKHAPSSLRLFTTGQHNPKVWICATHFMDDSFVNLGEYNAAQRLFKKKRGQFRICYDNL